MRTNTKIRPPLNIMSLRFAQRRTFHYHHNGMALHCIIHVLVCLTLLVRCEQYTQQTFCFISMKRRNIRHIVGHKCYKGQPSPIKTGRVLLQAVFVAYSRHSLFLFIELFNCSRTVFKNKSFPSSHKCISLFIEKAFQIPWNFWMLDKTTTIDIKDVSYVLLYSFYGKIHILFSLYL